MAISDAEFANWLATDVPRIVLWEQKFAYESGGAPVEGTVYFSTATYRTESGETPASTPYHSVINSVQPFERAVPDDPFAGRTEVGVGAVTLDNTGGQVDFMLDLIIDGREGVLLIGGYHADGTPWDRADFRTLFSCLAEFAEAQSDDVLTVTMRDHRLLLDKQIAGDVVTDERRKPLVFTFGTESEGACSIEPVLKNAGSLQYYVLQNYTNGGAVTAVEDSGVELLPVVVAAGVTNATLTADAGTDTLTYAAHPFALNDVWLATGTAIFAGLSLGTQYWVINPTTNTFQLSATKGGTAVDITGTSYAGGLSIRRGRCYDNVSVDGTIELSSTPAGRLIADVVGHSASQATSILSGGPGELLRAMLIDYGAIDSADINAASFTGTFATVDMTTTGVLATARAVLGRENLLDVLDDIARVGQIFWGPDHEGVFRAGRLDLDDLSGETSEEEITVDSIMGDPSVANARVVNGFLVLNSRRNHRVMNESEFVTSVSVSHRESLSGQYREAREMTAVAGTSYATNWQGFFKTARRFEAGGAFAQTNIGARDIIDEIMADQKPHIKTVRITLPDLRAYSWRLGKVVTFTYPRYGFDAGLKCRVVRITPDFVEETVALTLITKADPDYTSSSHH
jgi:hypothetical protein